jgi:hypothetical protein
MSQENKQCPEDRNSFSSERLVHTYYTTRSHNPEDYNRKLPVLLTTFVFEENFQIFLQLVESQDYKLLHYEEICP